MTPEEIALTEWYNSSEKSLRGELGLWEYYPSEIISKEILINMLQYIYFGGKKMELHEIEKQLIKYTKGHFKRINYRNDLRYFASELYGIGVEYIDQYNILHMVIDLYELLVKEGYIDFRLKFFLTGAFKRSWREGKTEIGWNTVIDEMLAEIQGVPVKGLGLGETNLSIVPEAVA